MVITKFLHNFQNLKALFYIPIFCLLFHFVWMDKERQYLTGKIFEIRHPTSNYCECGLCWPTSAWGSWLLLVAAEGLRTEAVRHPGNPWEGAGPRAGQRRAACRSVCKNIWFSWKIVIIHHLSSLSSFSPTLSAAATAPMASMALLPVQAPAPASASSGATPMTAPMGPWSAGGR